MSGGIKTATHPNEPTRGLSPTLWAGAHTELWGGLRGNGVFYSDDFMNFPYMEDFSEVSTSGMSSTTSRDVGSGYLLETSGAGVFPSASADGGVIEFKALTASANKYAFLSPAVGIGKLCSITDTSGSNYKTWFETRVKFSSVTVAHRGFIGLALVGALLSDSTLLGPSGGGLERHDFVGFQILQDDPNTLECVFSNVTASASPAEVVWNDATAALAADTWYKLGMYYDGTALHWALDGEWISPSSSFVTSYSANIRESNGKKGVLPAHTYFPDGDALAPLWAWEDRSTNQSTMSVDWWALGVELPNDA